MTNFKEYIAQAKADGLYNVTFTEHGNIFEWYHKKQEVEAAGFKYIHAVEAYITEFADEKVRDNYHCLLFARNHEGFKELNRLVSSSFNRADVKCYGDGERFYYTPRILFSELLSTSDNIIISTGCMAGILSKGNEQLKRNFIDFLAKNKHRCFLEVQHHNCEAQREYNGYLARLSKERGIPLLACTDTHSLNELHKKGRSLLQRSKNVYFDNEDEWDLVYKTYDELVEAFRTQQALTEQEFMSAIENTNKLVDMVAEFTLDTNTKYPKIYDNPVETFKNKINEAYSKHKYVRERYDLATIKNVLNEELEVYEKTKSIDFMLLQTYMREWEHENGIECGYGRGSVSGSEIAYILGITQMDSIKFDLNFFRFMNPSRVTNADIDTDYSSKDRDRVKYFLLHDHMNLPQIQSAEIITFNTIALKGAIRDVCRGIYKNPDNDDDKSYLRLSEEIVDLAEKDEEEARERFPNVFEYVDIVVGTVVSVGTHPSGVLISDRNLYEEIGLCSLSTSDYPVSMLNMKELDALMYVKLDILGLDNIGIINDTCKMLGIDRLTPDNVDLNDEAVWKSIRDDTTMIFQWESNSAQAYLRKFMSDETIAKAKSINPDFSYIKWFSFGNGLIRPGCASFRDDVADGNNIVTGFKELDDFLAITFGRVTMQEDIMKFLVKFCGYSDAESDTVRRGIAKKYGTEKFIDEIHDRFISYSHETYGAEVSLLEEIFPPIKQGILDASAYAFSWNHSDSYSCIGYICGYLRYYHPVEFVTAALNTFQDKEDKTIAIIEYAKKHHIPIKPIVFRHSGAEYTCDGDGNIYKGLASIKYLNGQIADELFELGKREYADFADLLQALEQTSLNSRQLDILIKLNFFEEFGGINYLLDCNSVFRNYYGKKTMKKDKAFEEHIDFDLLRKHSDKETAKTFSGLNSFALIADIIKDIPDVETDIKTILDYQLEHLGYINVVDKKYKGQCIVTDLNVKYSPLITLYALANGNNIVVKVPKKIFGKKPLKRGDVIHVKHSYLNNKSKWQDDHWVKLPEKEWWIDEYTIC